jgi:hypothetical protein
MDNSWILEKKTLSSLRIPLNSLRFIYSVLLPINFVLALFS